MNTRTILTYATLALLSLPAFVAAEAPRVETEQYVLAGDDLSEECPQSQAHRCRELGQEPCFYPQFSPGLICFEVVSGETSVHFEVRDVTDATIASSVVFRDDTGTRYPVGFFCSSGTFSIPSRATSVEIEIGAPQDAWYPIIGWRACTGGNAMPVSGTLEATFE